VSGVSRGTERRVGERRRPRRSPTADESWFGAFESAEDTQLNTDTVSAASELPPEPETAPSDSRFLSRQAERIVSAGQTAFDRIYRTFIGARAALGVAIVVALAVSGVIGNRPSLISALVSVAYGALALSTWLMPRRRAMEPTALARPMNRQWLATIGVDLLCFSALHLLTPGSSLNYVALLVLPVLMAGVLTPRVMALATAGSRPSPAARSPAR
jgi:two-component system sensor histidine kinase PilS (NtrC family)